MRITYFKYLLETAHVGSINKASQKLHLNQQQLSKIILKIEEEVGCTIFNRTSKGVYPTDCGEEVLKTFQEIVEKYDSLLEQIEQKHQTNTHETLTGTLLISTGNTIFQNMPKNKVFNEFFKTYPSVFLNINEQCIIDIIKSVVQQQADVGVIILSEELLRTNYLPENLTFIPLRHLQLAVHAAKKSLFAKKYKSISLKQLAKEPLVAYQPYSAKENNIEMVFEGIGIPTIKYNLSNLTLFHEILQQGHVVSLGMHQDDAYLDKYQLIEIPIRDKVRLLNGIIVDKNRIDEPLIHTFVQFYVDYFKKII